MSTEKLLMALQRFFRPQRSTIHDNLRQWIFLHPRRTNTTWYNSERSRRRQFPIIDGRKRNSMISHYTVCSLEGAVYERLIKSIKHSLGKTIGNRTLTTEELMTLMTEIEGSLNTRPLTYQDGIYDEMRPLRPIDFLVKDLEVTYPLKIDEWQRRSTISASN